MKKILIFSGTTEGREIAGKLAKAGNSCTVSVATEYGELVMQDDEKENITVRVGRMERGEMELLMRREAFDAVIDATHPYAVVVSENIRAAAEESSIPYYRLNREAEPGGAGREENVNLSGGVGREENAHLPPCAATYFSDMESCADYLEQRAGNILLTTGSKELNKFVPRISSTNRIYARVLPGKESFLLCEEAGIVGKQMIAMQGPFSAELNVALIHQFQIRYLVTKESGRIGGQEEKFQAAEQAGIEVCVIAKPKQIKGYSEKELLAQFCKPQKKAEKRKIFLVGIGMGNPATLTRKAEQALREAELFFGAERILKAVSNLKKPGEPLYLAEDVFAYLKERPEIKTAAVLFSGDLGFYSGAEKFWKKSNGQETFLVESYPGISSVSYFAAKLGVSYQDAALSSIHGRSANVAETVKRNEKSFFLLSGVRDVWKLKELLECSLATDELAQLELFLGYQLSYPSECIRRVKIEELPEFTEQGLYLAYVKNPVFGKNSLTHGLSDEVFIRGKVPMTKEEVREVAISKLRLGRDSVFYDIGSGTGSISIEAARISERIKVHAFEQKEEAVALLQKNCEKFGLCNVAVHLGVAPEGMDGITPPTHAFIGGSGGKLKEIVEKLWQINPTIRIVITAITLETLAEVQKLAQTFPVKEAEIIQLQVSRAKEMGNYHLMQAENPVYIASFTLCK